MTAMDLITWSLELLGIPFFRPRRFHEKTHWDTRGATNPGSLGTSAADPWALSRIAARWQYFGAEADLQ